jgi:hypothetical protein
MHNVHIRFFTPEQEALFQKCLAAIPNAANIIVQLLDRVGFSGARVFVFFPRGQHSNPHVGKIHTKEGIQREVSGRELAYHFFPEAMQAQFFVEADGGKDLAMLAIPLIASNDNSVTELKDILFVRAPGAKDPVTEKDHWFQYPIEFVIGVYKELYEQNCRRCFEGVERVSKVLETEYEWYLRGNRSERLIKGWLGT